MVSMIDMVVWSIVLFQCVAEQGQSLLKVNNMELQRQLAVLNKKPVKSFQIKGDVHDCINIFQQPALDHPSLKNHKIQMRPTYQPKSLINQASSTEHRKVATLQGVSCPPGTVPIQRTQKEDLLRAKLPTQHRRSNIHVHTADWPGQHVAALKPKQYNSTYYGVKARITVQNPAVKNDQFSTAQMWIGAGPIEQYTSLHAGWMVSPSVAGNHDTRLFIYWTTDNSKTGCFNLLCLGFVQVHPRFGPTSRVHPTSIYGGTQYAFDVTIFQDTVTGNWWFTYEGINIGYWPKSILPQLAGGASFLAWGGLAGGPPNEESPPMGNGHFPQGVWKKACYMEELHTVDRSGQYIVPDEYGMLSNVDNPNCYGLQYMGRYPRGGLAFMFGGPGGKCGV